ncbi:MAG TPA: hypothetical protein VGE93_02535 [Bryobacteraceae bacterium]
MAISLAVLASVNSWAADVPPLRFVPPPAKIEASPPAYYWKAMPVDGTAQLLTLFCRSCNAALLKKVGTSTLSAESRQTSGGDVPLVSVVRDTLGDTDPHNDRLLYVWLLSYVRPNLGQKILSAVPFFYWRVRQGPDMLHTHNAAAPLLDLTTPEHTLISGVGRQILQSSLLDPTAMPIRATSRAYRRNEADYERLHLEEAATYLRNAPASDSGNSLSQADLDSLLARLELRKRLLGGLVAGKHTARIGQEAGYAQERIRSRNWEVLRQCAERSGLIFEPLDLAGTHGSYAVLWFPLHTARPSPGNSLKPIWKLLNMRDPWTNRHFTQWTGPVFSRALDENGSLLPERSAGSHEVQLVPLGVYSLEYPKAPLLLLDFRSSARLRRTEMTQRAINDITAGVIGLSHFSNWYYYAAADLYDFIVSRHGAATNQAERLDCYSQFRVALVLDRKMDPELHSQMSRRVNSLAINPLEAAPDKELHLAYAHYELLVHQAQNGELADRINRDRRAELADFGESAKVHLLRVVLRDATFGAYTHRAKDSSGIMASLDRNRRVLYRLSILDSLAAAGTPPEVAYSTRRIQESVADLNLLKTSVRSRAVRAHAARTLEQLTSASEDPGLQADCTNALASMQEGSREPDLQSKGKQGRSSDGVVALISPVHPENVH